MSSRLNELGYPAVVAIVACRGRVAELGALVVIKLMGYDIHITRAEFWEENEEHEISLDEWLRYVESDREVQRDSQNSSSDFLFLAHPKDAWPLWWYRGEIYTKNPDKAMVRKMIEIAQKLRARVQGDDGEFYDDTSESPE